jgi:hypothetical protein
LLIQAESGGYVGCDGNSIRKAAAKGLQYILDSDNKTKLFHPNALDAWRWSCKKPTDAQRAKMLEKAAKRWVKREGREAPNFQKATPPASGRELAAEALGPLPPWARSEASEFSAMEASRARHKRNEQRAREFEAAHYDLAQTAATLDFQPDPRRPYSGDPKMQVKTCVANGWLTPIDIPWEEGDDGRPIEGRALRLPKLRGYELFFEKGEVDTLRTDGRLTLLRERRAAGAPVEDEPPGGMIGQWIAWLADKAGGGNAPLPQMPGSLFAGLPPGTETAVEPLPFDVQERLNREEDDRIRATLQGGRERRDAMERARNAERGPDPMAAFFLSGGGSNFAARKTPPNGGDLPGVPARRCDCGTVIPADTARCPSCGAWDFGDKAAE